MDSKTTETFTPVKDLTYSQALAELETIIRNMQNENCDIDRLASMTRRATELLAECKNRLTATDEELRQILAVLEA